MESSVLFCVSDFLISDWLGVPALKKICKNFKPDGEVLSVVAENFF